jgi:hypothetical protein
MVRNISPQLYISGYRAVFKEISSLASQETVFKDMSSPAPQETVFKEV